MTRAVTAVAFAAFAAFAAAACGRDPAIIAQYMDAGVDTETSAGADAGPCTVGKDTCAPGYFCELPDGCTATTGQCAPVTDAASCASTFLPVCGCDKITYFNDCLRQSAAQSAMGNDVCTYGTSCGFDGTCQGDQKCVPIQPSFVGQLVDFLPIIFRPEPNETSEAICESLPRYLISPTCWVVPSPCPTGAGEVQDICSVFSSACVTIDACEAVTGASIYSQWPCPQ